MVGGAGNDVYVVDDAGDTTIEAIPEDGTDRVEAAISYVLGAHFEQLVLTGDGNLIGTGNELDNLLLGNAGDNRLDGGVGADQLFGGAGNDALVGWSGADRLGSGLISSEPESC